MTYKTLDTAAGTFVLEIIHDEDKAKQSFRQKINEAVKQAMEKYKETLIRLADR